MEKPVIHFDAAQFEEQQGATLNQLRAQAVRRERQRWVKVLRFQKWYDRAIYTAATLVMAFPLLAYTKIQYDISRGNDIPSPVTISYYFTEWGDAFNEAWTEVTGWFEASN